MSSPPPPLPPHLDPRGRHRGRAAASGGSGHAVAWRPIGRTLGVLISVALLVVAGYYWYTFRQIDNKVPRGDVVVGQAPSGASSDIDGKDQNILVVGNDDRSTMTKKETKELHVGTDGGSLATDTMMIVHVPANGARATLISLPRDAEVQIPGHGEGLLNSAYATAYSKAKGEGKSYNDSRKAGADLLVQTITNLTGLTINHYIQVDLLGFYRISNAVGGVTIDLCHDVNDTHKYNVEHGQDGGSGLVLSKGKHTIHGLQALEFVRQRHNLAGGDLDRVKRQQYFLTAAFRQVASVGILTKLNSIGSALERSVFIDRGLNLIDLAKQLQNLTANKIVGKTIPVTPNGAHFSVDPGKVKKFVAKVIAGTSGSASPSPSSKAPQPGASSSKSASPSPSTSSAIDSKCIN